MRTMILALAALCGSCSRDTVPPTARQPLAVLTLDQPDRMHPAVFTSVTDVHELPDGRVLVSDREEKNVVLLDFTAGTSTPVGRQGSGPGEYRFPGRFFPQPDGTTLLNDFFLHRFLVIDSGGRAGDVMPFPDAGGIGIEGGSSDALGRIYFRARPFGDPEGPGPSGRMQAYPDSLAIMRWDPGSGAVDTAGWVSAPRIAVSNDAAGVGGVSLDPPVFTPGDVWEVAPDGTVARVVPDPYHIVWYGGDSVAAGPGQPYTPIAVTEADRSAYYEEEKGRRPIEVGVGDRGVTSIGEGRPVNQPGRRKFAETKPPFLFDADVLVTPDGEAWVPRTRLASDSIPTYDVFDRAGRKVGEVKLRPSSRVVGFGNGTIHVARTDADGLEHLERFRREQGG